MGFLADLFGGGGKKQAQTAKLASRWLPPQINLGGATSNFDRGNPFKDIPGSASVSLSPGQQSFYDSLSNFATGAMNRLSNPADPAVAGYPGISPELYNEFNLSNGYNLGPLAQVGNAYMPNLGNMPQVGKVSYDGSGMPQISFNAQGMPQVDAGPAASAGVNWSGKAESLDQNYLDKSKAFLNASDPVTGFKGLGEDWYKMLTQLSQNDANNMLAATGDKEFLRGMLGGGVGAADGSGNYNPAMKGAFDAYNDADLKNKMAGYQVAADASTRNLQQALQAGGYVQQNDQTRLQQAIAQGQIDAQMAALNKNAGLQASMANAGNWLSGQGLGLQAQQANASNWLSGQGLNLQAQGMNQSADAQNAGNWLTGEGLMSDAYGQQMQRDLSVNNQTMARDAQNIQRSDQRFLNAMNMFGTGQNSINSETQRLMQMLGAGAGGMQGYDQYLLQMLGLQGNLASGQSGANNAAYNPAVQQGMNQSNFWASLINSGAEGYGAYKSSDRRLKTNIEQIGTTEAGYPWYKFDYVWGTPSEGVMADEVPSDWVSYDASGFAVVDYSKVK